MSEQQVKLQGHVIDRQILSRVLDAVELAGGSWEIAELSIGRTRRDESTVLLNIGAPDQATLTAVLSEISLLGAVALQAKPAVLHEAPADGVLPDRFYATTNLPTQVLVGEKWLAVEGTEMDLAIVVEPQAMSAHAVPMADVRKGQRIVVGGQGVRVHYPDRNRQEQEFRVMA
ncbi:MAG: TIGR00300 family protein, partial [Syntrophotalea acetylenica]|nr:TIGR00300 family protein [Syntrophotalea acetylenica]